MRFMCISKLRVFDLHRPPASSTSVSRTCGGRRRVRPPRDASEPPPMAAAGAIAAGAIADGAGNDSDSGRRGTRTCPRRRIQ
jgi:hypothetical protein